MKRTMTVALSAIVMIAAASIACAATSPAKKLDDTALATVNGDPVTVKDLLAIFTDRHSGHARFLGGDAEARTFLNLVIDDRLLVQEAYDIGLDQDPSVKQLVGDYENEKASKYFVLIEIDDKAKPSREEVRAVWEKDLTFFLRIRQIAVDTRQEAEEIRTALLHGGDFEALARACSVADSRVHGGHLVVNWGQFEPEWERAVLPLREGDVSPVIATEDGYEVVLVDARLDAPHPDFDKVSSQIESTLRERRLKERKRASSEELWSTYHVVQEPMDMRAASLSRLLATAPDSVIATWDGGKLTVKEAFSADELRMFSTLPAERGRKEIESRIRATINGPLLTLAAKDRKIADVPEVADPVTKYREYVMESVLFRDHIFKEVAVNDDGLRKYYEEHKSDFEKPEERHVAHILVSSEADAINVRKQLAGGADFAELVKKSSRDFVTVGSDGSLGWITADKVPPAFREVLTIGAGDVSKPVKDISGWHLVKVLEIKPKRQLALDEVRDKVREKALDQKQRAARAYWVKKLRGAAKIEIHDAAIRDFVRANAFKAGQAPPQHKLQ